MVHPALVYSVYVYIMIACNIEHNRSLLILNSEDDRDIMQQTRFVYTRANMVIRKFFNVSLGIKIMLLKAYCT